MSTDIDSIPGGFARGESNLFCNLICGSSVPGHRSVPERGEISVRPRFREVLPILPTALCLVSFEK